MKKENIKVFIIEDELLIAKDIKSIIKNEGYAAIGIADRIEKVKAFFNNQNDVDIVICDINLKGDKDGIEVIEYLRKGHFFKSLYLTAYSDQGTIDRMKKQRTDAYIVKPFTPEQLLATLSLIKPSEQFMREKVLIQSLGKREMEICKLMLEGLDIDSISEKLFISKHTVLTHKKNIYKKLNITKITELFTFELFEHFERNPGNS